MKNKESLKKYIGISLFVIITIIMFYQLCKIYLLGANVLGFDESCFIPPIYFFGLLAFYIYEKNFKMQGLQYDLEYWKKQSYEKYIEEKENESN